MSSYASYNPNYHRDLARREADRNAVALGVRTPGQENIVFAVFNAGDAAARSQLLPVLQRDFSHNPYGALAEAAPDRRAFNVPNSVPFHDVAREAQADQWLLYQNGQWEAGQVQPRHPDSLLTRLYRTARDWGGDRFEPAAYKLGAFESPRYRGDGGRGRMLNCFMGMATEMFLDDYPTALTRVVGYDAITGPMMAYRSFAPDATSYTNILPDLTRKQLGFASSTGDFRPDPSTIRFLERSYNRPIRELEKALVGSYSQRPEYSLTRLNDAALNWPVAAELLALPAPGLYEA